MSTLPNDNAPNTENPARQVVPATLADAAADADIGAAVGAAATTEPKLIKIPLKALASYFGFGMGQCFSFGLVGTFILFFYTDIMGISPVAASMIFLIARIWDAFNDPIFAGLIDSLNLKRGKYRPFLGFMPFVIVIITILAFINIDGSLTTKTLYAGFTYILWGTLYTISDLPFWSMTTVLSDHPQERAKAATCAMMGVNAGIGSAMVFFPYLAKFFAEGRDDQGYLPAVIVMMIAGLVLMLNGYINTREKVRPQGDAAKVTLVQTFKVVLANKPLFYILAAFFLNVFTNIAGNINIYFFTYNLGDGTLMSVLGVISISCALACLITPMLTAKWRKRDIFMVLCIVEILLRLGFFFTGYDNVTLVFVWIGLIIITNMMTNPLVSTMIADTVEYSYYHTGKRCAAITFAGQTFTGKLAVAIAGGVAGIILAQIGYTPNQEQSEDVLFALFACVSLLPIIGCVLRLVVLKFYTFNEEQHAEIVRKLSRGEFDITHKI